MDLRSTVLSQRHLSEWMPADAIKISIPLTEKYSSDNYVIHHYSGFDISTAIAICDEMLRVTNLTEAVDIYLYLVDYPHEYNRLDRLGCNNGYTQMVGRKFSVVLFRKKFWPKVLIHELLHVLWLSNDMPVCTLYPKWDEAIIEAHAVNMAISRGYINAAEYNFYLQQSRRDVMSALSMSNQNIKAGRRDIDIYASLKNKQRTHVYEYIFLSEQLRALINGM